MKVEINGRKLHYEIFGQTGTPVVLIHGFGLDHSIWKEMVLKYLQNHRVILPDVCGHGKSDAPVGVYSMTELAEDIYQLLRFLRIDHIVLCGHSMGGYISLAFAEKYPNHLSGLGLITTHARRDTDEKAAARYELADAVQSKGSIVLAESMTPLLTENEAVQAYVYDLIKKTPPEGIIGAAKGMAERPDRLSLLNNFDLPALVVAGKADQITPLEKAQEMADALPRSELLILSNAGHMPMLESAAELGRGINQLIERAGNKA